MVPSYDRLKVGQNVRKVGTQNQNTHLHIVLTYVSGLLFRPTVLLPRPERGFMRPHAAETLQMPRSGQQHVHQKLRTLLCGGSAFRLRG